MKQLHKKLVDDIRNHYPRDLKETYLQYIALALTKIADMMEEDQKQQNRVISWEDIPCGLPFGGGEK